MWGNEEGYTTVETAIALAAITVVLAGILSCIVTLGAQLRAIQLAGAGARAAAIGEPFHPDGGSVSISVADGMVTATSSVSSPLGVRHASAIFPQELSADGS